MKRVFTALILSLLLLGTPAAEAASNGHGHGHVRKEQKNFERKVRHEHKKEFKEMLYRRYPKAHHMRVWAVSPGVYMLRYLLDGIWYMQEIYPARHAYGKRMRVYDGGDYWYGNNGIRYYDHGDDLIYNGSVMPAIQLNINL